VRTRLASLLAVVGVAGALITAVPTSASAVPGQDFEGFALGSVNGQNGWTVTNSAFDYAIADTTGLYGGALGTRALRVSNAVTSGSFGDQLFSEQLANEAGETTAENGGLSGGVRQKRYSTSFTFASADPSAEQPGLVLGVSPDRGDGARMSLVRLYDTPTGLKVTAFGFNHDDGDSFPETTVAANLDRTAVHTLSLTMDLVDGVANDRVSISVDAGQPVVIGSWEEYFRVVEGNPSRTVDSLLFRASIAAPNSAAIAGKGFYIDAVQQASGITPTPPLTPRTMTPTDLANAVGGWQAFRESSWPNSATARFVDGPAGTSGPGSMKVSLGPVVSGNNGKYYLGRSVPNVPLGDVTGFSYSIYTPTTNNGVMQPYVNIPISGGGVTYANLVYDPNDPASNPNAVPSSNGVWRTFDPFSPTAKWRATRVLAGKPTWTYRTLAEWLQLAPDLRTHPAVGGVFVVFGASSVYTPWTDFVGYLGGFDLTVAGGRTVDSFDLGPMLPPASVVVSDLTTHSAKVSWTLAPGTLFAPYDGYEVVVDGTPQTVTPDVTSLDISPLSPGTTHRVSVRGFRGSEMGGAVAASFVTPEIPLPAAVTGLTVGSITTTGASASWTPDATVGEGAVDRYEVTVTPSGATTVQTGTTFPLTGLTPASTYSVTVRAHNVSGWSDPTSATFTTNDLDRRTPGAPALTVGPPVNGDVAVSWAPNAGDSTDFPVLHWIVSVDGADEAYLPAATLQTTVTSLAEGRHTVSVRGVNAIGSDAFAAQVVVVPSSAPAPPVQTSSMTATPSLISYGATSRLTGSFLNGSAPVADSVVTLWTGSGSSWTNVGSTLTGADGSFGFTVKPSTTTQYRAVTSGMPSAYASVSVRPKVTLKVTYTAVRGKTVVGLALGVTPAMRGAVVRLQKLVGTKWLWVTWRKLDAKSRAVFAIGSFSKRYIARYRIVVPATTTSAMTTSSAVLVATPRR
jgi:hypothetical protein